MFIEIIRDFRNHDGNANENAMCENVKRKCRTVVLHSVLAAVTVSTGKSPYIVTLN